MSSIRKGSRVFVSWQDFMFATYRLRPDAVWHTRGRKSLKYRRMAVKK